MKVLFMGTPAFAVPSLAALLNSRHRVLAVVTQPDRPSGRGLEVHESPVKDLASRRILPILQPTRLRSGEFPEQVGRLAPDALVVVAYGRILPPGLLAAAPLGGVNVHASLLPKYRGAAPIAWAIAAGETETGVTTMKMVEKMDAGDILLQRSTAIGPGETTAVVEARLARMGADLLIETLDALEAGQMAGLPQREERATFAPILKKEDGHLDWTAGAATLARRVRAFDPWPVAWTRGRKGTIRVWRAEAEEGPGDGEPGRVLQAGPAGVKVACGAGSRLLLRDVQPEGKRRMSAAEAAAGRHLSAGDRLS